MGNFRSAGILSDQFGRDDRIDAVLRTRVDELLATQLDLLPADDRRKSVKAAAMLGGVEDGPGEWERMFPDGVLSKLMRTGLCLNFAVARILWSFERGIHWPRLEFWNSQFVRWDQTKRVFLLQQEMGPEIELPRLDQNPIGDGQWFVWCPFGYPEAWLGGMVRSLAPLYMRRMWVNRDKSRASELYGQGLVKAIVPADQGTSPSGEAFLEQVANRGAEPTIKVPQGGEGKNYDVEIETSAQNLYEAFREGKSDVNTDIAVLILGQPDTTEAPTGGLSHGEMKGPRQVVLNKARKDAALASALRDQVLVPMMRFNFGDPDIAPLPIYRVDPPDDDGKKAELMKKAGDGIKSLQDAGVAIDVRSTAEDFGVKQLTPEQQAKAEQEQAEKFEQQQQEGDDDPNAETPAGGLSAKKTTEEGSAALRARHALADKNVTQRYEFSGLAIAVENLEGTTRAWHDEDGNERGTTLMQFDYGFLESHMGADGEEIDVYIGPNEDAPFVHIVHQLKAPKYESYDEDKVFIGFDSADAARAAYVAHRSDGDQAIKAMTSVSLADFKAKLKKRKGGGMIHAKAITLNAWKRKPKR